MSHNVSAFAAINKSDVDLTLGIEEEEEEEVVIKYENSSSESDGDNDFEQATELPSLGSLLGAPITQTTSTTITTQSNRFPTIKPITASNFKPNDDNLIFHEDSVTIGLKQGEYLLIKGQYSVTVQRGCLKIDNILHHAAVTPINIIAPSLMALPVLYLDQVIDRSIVNDQRTAQNEHLFSSDYKTVIKVANHFTGLESVGKLYPSLKNIFPDNDPNSEDLATMHEFEIPFKEFSFQPIFQDQGMQSSVSGVIISKVWQKQIESITNEIINFNKDFTDNQSQLRILVIGPKNSGKSTFAKLLTNYILYKTDYCIPLNMMDLDPGQPECSQPDCVSISLITKELMGFNLGPLVNGEDPQNKVLLQQYVGYSNPNRLPTRYKKSCLELCEYYHSHLSSLGQPLIINTPGWIKGYGVEVLKEITDIIKPTHLIFASPSSNSNIDLDSELFLNLTYDNIVQVTGFVNAIAPRYSAAQLRNFKSLAYFHYTKNQKPDSKSLFDFTPLMLSHSPYQLSFSDTDILNFKGISLLKFLENFSNIHQLDLVQASEAVVMAIFTIDVESFQNLILAKKVAITTGFPNLISDELPSDLEFKGLTLIHSVDLDLKLFNLYTPIDTKNVVQDGKVMLLVRGRTEIPIEEIAPKAFFKSQPVKQRQMPYITFDKSAGKGAKVLKVRKNIMRRSHQH